MGSGWQSGMSCDVFLAPIIPGNAGDSEHVSLVECVGLNKLQRLRLHDHTTPCNSLALGIRFPANVDHLGVAALVYVGQPGSVCVGQLIIALKLSSPNCSLSYVESGGIH